MEITHGPWRAEYHEPGNDIQGGLAGYSIQTQNPGEGIAYNICREANARLIAEAPAMLEALKAMTIAVKRLRDGERSGGAFGDVSIADDAVRAIIDRIEGTA